MSRQVHVLFWDVQLAVSLIHSNFMLEGLTQMILKVRVRGCRGSGVQGCRGAGAGVGVGADEGTGSGALLEQSRDFQPVEHQKVQVQVLEGLTQMILKVRVQG